MAQFVKSPDRRGAVVRFSMSPYFAQELAVSVGFFSIESTSSVLNWASVRRLASRMPVVWVVGGQTSPFSGFVSHELTKKVAKA